MGLMRLGIKVDCVGGVVSYSGMNEMTRVHAKNGRSLPGSYFCLPRMSSTYRRFSCPVKMSRGGVKRCLSDSPLKLHHRTKHSCDIYLFIFGHGKFRVYLFNILPFRGSLADRVRLSEISTPSLHSDHSNV